MGVAYMSYTLRRRVELVNIRPQKLAHNLAYGQYFVTVQHNNILSPICKFLVTRAYARRGGGGGT